MNNSNKIDNFTMGPSNEETRERQHEQTTSSLQRHHHNPVTVSSFSSIDTAGYDLNDNLHENNHNSNNHNITQLSTTTLLPPFPLSSSMHESSNSLMDNSNSGTPYAASSQQPQQQQPQQHQQPTQPSSLMTTAGGTNNVAMQPPPPPTSSSTEATNSGVQSVAPTTNAVPEFLYQLTKMLTDNNREIIEWSNGKLHSCLHLSSLLTLETYFMSDHNLALVPIYTYRSN